MGLAKCTPRRCEISSPLWLYLSTFSPLHHSHVKIRGLVCRATVPGARVQLPVDGLLVPLQPPAPGDQGAGRQRRGTGTQKSSKIV